MAAPHSGRAMRLRFPRFGFARQFQTDFEVLARRGGHQRARFTERIAALDRLAGTAVLAVVAALLAWLIATQSTVLDIAGAAANGAYKATFGPSQAEAERLQSKSPAAPLTAR